MINIANDKSLLKTMDSIDKSLKSIAKSLEVMASKAGKTQFEMDEMLCKKVPIRYPKTKDEVPSKCVDSKKLITLEKVSNRNLVDPFDVYVEGDVLHSHWGISALLILDTLISKTLETARTESETKNINRINIYGFVPLSELKIQPVRFITEIVILDEYGIPQLEAYQFRDDVNPYDLKQEDIDKIDVDTPIRIY